MSSRTRKIKEVFDRDGLKNICEMHEDSFADTYHLDPYQCEQRWPADSYYYRDNGSDILAVAHLDTVVDHTLRTCNFLNTVGGPVVYSGALDDRLGAYIILELLPALGIEHDILLTTGEESGRSTASFFESFKDYNWMIEFDRGGTDVVMYQYDNEFVAELVEDSGARAASGIFSDICYLEHLGIKGFNWGVGYQDYHSTRSHAYLDDTYAMVARYLRFHEANSGLFLPHEKKDNWWSSWGQYGGDPYGLDDDLTTVQAEHAAEIELWSGDSDVVSDLESAHGKDWDGFRWD